MKKHFFLLTLQAFFGLVSAQAVAQVSEPPVFRNPPPPVSKDPVVPGEPVYEYVDEPAEFPGGMQALRKFMADNLKYPESALKDSIQGKCVVKLLITDKGEVKKAQITKSIPDCPDCDNEVLRIMALMPNWTPGRVNGKYVNSYFRLPVTFRL